MLITRNGKSLEDNVKMKQYWKHGLILLVLILFFVNDISASSTDEYAITFGEDKRIYIIDLHVNEVINKSQQFDKLGNPTSIDFDKNTGKIYVGSMRGHWQKVFEPLAAIKIKMDSFGDAERLELVPYEVDEYGIGNMAEVYKVRLSPDGKKLYVMFGHPDYREGNAVFDIKSSRIVNKLNFFIEEHDLC